ncbi:ABC transporter permease [Leucobacter insecticola]|uniref:ABC transporter permease n=1 Tax=Leucobacter insecticola TaxID=2714934 RepID=A0A6G8FKH6_9MICO|nr:ABC transporter permease [Leucobacter insecticola]QIM16789.1 ABC transporter permease [Leucobacter insecticola]
MTFQQTPETGSRTAFVPVAVQYRGIQWTRLGFSVWRIAVPVVIALAMGALALLVGGKNPLEIYNMLVREAFGDWARINATLTAATPLLFTGLAAALAFRAGVFNVGVEGSFAFAGLATAVVGTSVGGLPPVLAVLACLIAGALAGMLVALVPALLRTWLGVDEVVSTLMFNFIVVGLTAWLVQSFFLAPGQANSATAYLAETAELAPLVPPGQLSIGFVIALLLVLGYAAWARHSRLGFEFEAVGKTPRFSVAQGLRVRTVLMISMLASGAIGGLGGAVHALGVVHRFSVGFSASFGFTGIAIALLARFNPIGIVIGAIAFGALAAAGTTVQLFVNIPIQLIDILQGTVMMLAVAQFAIPRLRRRKRATSGTEDLA